jgi:predicted nucleic acid-binding protein
MALIVIDASLGIALLDPADMLHAAAVTAFFEMATDDLVMPASALSETLVAPAREGKLEQARSRLQRLEVRVAAADEQVAVEAARLRGHHRSLRLPDALVIATGEVLEADSTVTCDRRWQRVSRRVRVVGRRPSG